ncbi:MAG: hypothetical protein LBP53_05735 [Candidatus Peribacteria bacterium]|jgi:hypothetical protein|nr:hypothetical protein [Candidatus Peribacteria bacterium]
MSIKTDLQTFYDYEAHKYYQTRKKYRKEGERIIKLLTPLFQEAHQKKKTLNILEI